MDNEAQTRRLLASALEAREAVTVTRARWAAYVVARVERAQVVISGEEAQAQADLSRRQSEEKLEWSLLGQYIGLTPSALAAIKAWAAVE